MRGILLAGGVLLSAFSGLTRIHDRNQAIAQGAAAYARQEYAMAAVAYKKAAVTLGAKAEAVWLNLAHASARAGQKAEARAYYGRLLSSKNPHVHSVALQQLATLATDKGDYAQAIALLRQALLVNPANTDARYNYEVLRDYLARRTSQPQLPPPGSDGGPGEDQSSTSQANQTRKGNKQGVTTELSQPQNPQNAPQTKADVNGQPDPSQPSANRGNSARGSFQPGTGEQRSVAKGSQPGSVRGLSDEETGPEAPGGSSRRGGAEAATNTETNLQTQRARLQQMNISAGQARQILDALQAAEQQYLQQIPRKASKPNPTDKPRW